jgi:uncharacterized protein (TIGR03118 family)
MFTAFIRSILPGKVRKLQQKRRISTVWRGKNLQFELLECRCVLATSYLAADLVSNQPGVAPIQDSDLLNGWGISLSPTQGAFWVSSHGADLSTLYAGDVGGNPLIKVPLEVTIPGGTPTGQVFNSTTDFVVSAGGNSLPAIFLFATESGAVTGWHPAVPPPFSANAQLAFQATDGAVYTGMALANNGSGNFLYLADFENGEIDVLNASFQLTTLAGSFTDPSLPAGFSPFNVAAISGKLYVSYARQDGNGDGDPGRGGGLINVFDLNGNFLQRLVTHGKLNAPWGVALAPAGFGDFAGDLLVGNFGDGRINAYDPASGALQGTLSQSPGRPIVIDGLRGLAFGNGVSSGELNSLYFAAGPGGGADGLFGEITANAPGTNPVQATLTDGDLMILGSRNGDQVQVTLNTLATQIIVRAGGQQIGSFPLASVETIRFQGLAGNDQIHVSSAIALTTILDGGAGHDLLVGGRGSNILLGGTGADALFGSVSRDILIGGEGNDLLVGNGADDLLIGGSTAHDANPAALLQILAEWTSGDDYATRVSKLRTGAGGLPILDATTVIDDGSLDILLGGLGLDWFFAGAGDLVPGHQAGEQVN